ncbi:MAG: MaoC family dehydratase N-terminal domain-containing protein [Acidimicrobiia bacterium]
MNQKESAAMGTLYEDRLAEHVGNECARIESVDPVCPQMIRHWIEVMEDANPAYTDPEWAADSRFGGLVAPGSMMQVWSMAPLWPHREIPQLPIVPIDEILTAEGFTEVVATGQSQEINRLARAGETVWFTVRLASVTPEPKKTRLGTAYFVTFEYRFTSEDPDDLIGTQSFTYMRYKPDAEEPAA